MENTPNYVFKKPEPHENYNVSHQNDNMDLIDEALTPSADPDEAPTGLGPGKLYQWIGWITNRIKAITGKSNWWDAPSKTMEQLKNDHMTHKTEEMPHRFVDGGTTYTYGWRVENGDLQFIYEEV
ncbi:hypothetical protein [Tindallia californiensis]|uniref:Uncharacterized protein n=1 Tax=Tindallia californiensis TaxID=159292 RepID=A0A1H3R3M0_9FIRM|nr:hypothetical protein [Tindallia californiensis]SDZ19549.1 hypothetical protein SAMN05192546_11187 [Tindallia californiensis]